MKRWVLVPVVLICAVSLALSIGLPHSRGAEVGDLAPPRILAFDTMYGVEGPLLGEANSIRGIVGDELPWAIAHFIKGSLDKNGRLKVLVRGLVFADDPLVPPELVGKNDESRFRGVVSCLTEDGQDNIVTANVTTGGSPATTSGDSVIDETLDLPNPCIAPIVFVIAGSEDKWFAVTGFESESNTERHR